MTEMSRAELLALPPTTDLVTAARALGIGRTTAYELARAGEFPTPILRLGARYRVVTSGLLAALGLDAAGGSTAPTPARPPAQNRAAAV
jgi:Helix-turn-helix domain